MANMVLAPVIRIVCGVFAVMLVVAVPIFPSVTAVPLAREY